LELLFLPPWRRASSGPVLAGMRRLRFPVLVLALECCQQAVRCRAEDDETCPAGSPGCGAGEVGGGLDDEDLYEDKKQCEAWARACECQLNSKFMLTKCARSCRLHGDSCIDKDHSCTKVTLKKRCTPEQWSVCPKICKLYQEERKKMSGQKKMPVQVDRRTADLNKKTKLDEKFQYGKPKGKCERRETPGGLQDTSVPAMFKRIEESEWAQKYEPKVLSRDPWIMYIDKFLTDQQVDDLLAAVNESGVPFQPSFELQAGHSQRRKSESLFCSVPKCFRDPRILAVHSVASNVTGLHLLNHEYMQVLKYRSGDFYVTHQDTSNEYGWSAAGHRIYTLFVYLSTVPPGFGGEEEAEEKETEKREKKQESDKDEDLI
ncbi:unnamed protein product, partial [Prorocentrum cordatum]